MPDIVRSESQWRKLKDVLETANPMLQKTVSDLVSYVVYEKGDISELEIKDAVWSCDDRLAIKLEVDHEPTELEHMLMYEDYMRMLKYFGVDP